MLEVLALYRQSYGLKRALAGELMADSGSQKIK